MPAITGSAMIALWNGVDPARRPEYDLWHTREHVPERVAVPGMIGARRYIASAGPLPDYLTLYDLREISVLASAPYRGLLANPTPWTLGMRPSFRGFMRLCCRREFSVGGGLGGVLGAVMLHDVAPDLREMVSAVVGQPGIVAAHLILRDPSIADVPFTIGGDAPDFPRGGAILLESYDEGPLAAALDGAAGQPAIAIETFSTYRLAYAVDREDLATLMPYPQS